MPHICDSSSYIVSHHRSLIRGCISSQDPANLCHLDRQAEVLFSKHRYAYWCVPSSPSEKVTCSSINRRASSGSTYTDHNHNLYHGQLFSHTAILHHFGYYNLFSGNPENSGGFRFHTTKAGDVTLTGNTKYLTQFYFGIKINKFSL